MPEEEGLEFGINKPGILALPFIAACQSRARLSIVRPYVQTGGRGGSGSARLASEAEGSRRKSTLDGMPQESDREKCSSKVSTKFVSFRPACESQILISTGVGPPLYCILLITNATAHTEYQVAGGLKRLLPQALEYASQSSRFERTASA